MRSLRTPTQGSPATLLWDVCVAIGSVRLPRCAASMALMGCRRRRRLPYEDGVALVVAVFVRSCCCCSPSCCCGFLPKLLFAAWSGVTSDPDIELLVPIALGGRIQECCQRRVVSVAPACNLRTANPFVWPGDCRCRNDACIAEPTALHIPARIGGRGVHARSVENAPAEATALSVPQRAESLLYVPLLAGSGQHVKDKRHLEPLVPRVRARRPPTSSAGVDDCPPWLKRDWFANPLESRSAWSAGLCGFCPA